VLIVLFDIEVHLCISFILNPIWVYLLVLTVLQHAQYCSDIGFNFYSW